MTDYANNELLDAIDRLTKPSRSKVMQDADTPNGHRLVTVELEPLLTRLQQAIHGTIGKGSSGSLASERSMLDGDALHRFMKIASQVQEWARTAGAPITKSDPVQTLRAWYIRYQQRTPSLESERFHARELNSWAYQIEAKLDPPRVWDLPDRCPACDAASWFNPTDRQEYLRPLVVEYKPTGPDMIQQAQAKCRACDQRWGVRELAYALEIADGLHIEDATA